MKDVTKPILLVLVLGIILATLPFMVKQGSEDGIPMYEIQKDGSHKLIRIVPLDKHYVPSTVITESNECIVAEKV